jgi:type IV secretion system protein VirD4
MNATKILWGQVLVVSAVVLAFLWGATEWVAWRLAFQPELGRPWFNSSRALSGKTVEASKTR